MGQYETNIVNDLSALIMHNLKNLNSERRYPGLDPDKMDEDIKDYKEKYLKLSNIRTEFELVMSGIYKI